MNLTRRNFITVGTAGLTAAALRAQINQSVTPNSPKWTIGCFNRPWTRWSLDETLTSIHGAGYTHIGLLTPTKADVFTNSAAAPEYLRTLKSKIDTSGLRLNMTALRIRNDLPLKEAVADTRQQLTNAHTLGVEFALTFGVEKREHYTEYYKVMSDAAAFAQERGIRIVLKPHGGGSGASEEILRSIKEVGHPNFKVWYDAGNIVYYTGKDPIRELEPIAQYVTGFCAKDCSAPKADVMVQFGTGIVDFSGIFARLKRGGFNGPIMVECCKVGETPQQTMLNARANREYLLRALAIA
jgi:sugar phosphate isomerase/epimerase